MRYLLILCFCCLLTTSCGIYSFTGTSISAEVKSVSIGDFPNLATIVEPTLSQTLIEKMKDKFTGATRLDLEETGGDLEFSGAVTNYNVTYAAAGANDQSALNRLTISIRVEYINNVSDESWSDTFQNSQDFDRNVSLSDVEQTLIDQITDDLVESVFNKAFNNW